MHFKAERARKRAYCQRSGHTMAGLHFAVYARPYKVSGHIQQHTAALADTLSGETLSITGMVEEYAQELTQFSTHSTGEGLARSN